MAANPALVEFDKELTPAPYDGERIILKRSGIKFEVTEVRTNNGRWSSKGCLYLTDMRIVFVSSKLDAKTGLQAFDLPLAYLSDVKFQQPILGANYLEGKTLQVLQIPQPAAPKHHFKLHLRQGGCGTLLKLLFQLMPRAQRAAQQQQMEEKNNRPPMNYNAQTEEIVSQAFVDPSDPSKMYFQAPPIQQSNTVPPPGYPQVYKTLF